ncbi:kinesin light chain [Trichoderma cornu-damae]|uniref:Kinesin light chain n=1 Tax=Trichoderma cornu-damae TaxID=654480 RepID=A0A9P8QL53_9HYPO|nr:kinesin light chain [Trichoderma cornu-damae]
MTMRRPSCREDFEVAIICALPLEYDAVALQFDEFWDEDGDAFGRAAGDPNTYTTGRIGKHDVVLALLPHMGKVHAAAAAASMRSSYGALRIVILAGICGGVPHNSQGEVLLGDVVISKSVVQYDLGRKYPNEFVRKDTVDDDLGKHDKNIRGLLAIFNTGSGQDKLEERTAHFLRQLQEKAAKHQARYRYPGASEDRLFQPGYRHKHHASATCICSGCHGSADPVCDEALASACDALGCDERYLVKRRRLEGRGEPQKPAVHIGAVASGDTVMKSGEDRDRIAEKEGVIAFEMEGAGVWEEMPCLVVKGVCDYADCHKNKAWQDFAAATAASAAKAILERYVQTDGSRGRLVEQPPRSHFLVPFGRNQSFVGRDRILSELLERIAPAANKDDCQSTVIEGLGGVGKTQIALEAVYRVRNKHPDCSIFWVPTVNAATFEKAYHDMGKQLSIEGLDEDKADVKRIVKNALSQESIGSWLMVIDNADDVALLFGAAGLLSHLPFSRKGSILFTTRNHEMAVRLDIPARSIIRVAEMAEGEALHLLQKGLEESQTSNAGATERLLGFLANLPLAIKQASAYMAAKQISASEYLELCESEPADVVDLLSRDFEDRYRYKEVQNPVATTWLISFSHILQHDRLAAEYLEFISVLAEKDIPKSLLPEAGKVEATDAIGTLKAYAFITQHEGKSSFDMHRLVRLAMRNWLEKEGELGARVTSAIRRLNLKIKFPKHVNRDVWMEYLPHAQAALEFPGRSADSQAEGELLSRMAESHSLLGQFQAAEELYRQSLELIRIEVSNNRPFALAAMNNFAVLLGHLGKYKEAEQMNRQTLSHYKEDLGNDHPNTLASMTNLADMLGKQGKYKEAEQMHRQTLELREKALGLGHIEAFYTMQSLSDTLASLGKHKEAEQMQRQIIDSMEKSLGSEHPDVLSCMNNLANTFIEADIRISLGQHEEAERMYRRILELHEEALGKDHPNTLASMNSVANALMGLGKYNEAENLHRQGLELLERGLGKDHPSTLSSVNNLALTLARQGRHKEAEQMHRQTLELRKKILGEDHPQTLHSMFNLYLVLAEQGRHKEAEQMRRQTLKQMERVFGKDHPHTQSCRKSLAGCSGADKRRGFMGRKSLSRLLRKKK